LDYFDVDYRFSERGRAYVSTRRKNIERLAEVGVAELHPQKKKALDRLLDRFQETHYPQGWLKEAVYSHLVEPYNTRTLAATFDRSSARLCDVLMELKKEGKIMNYKAGRTTYWIRNDQDTIIISNVKQQYLDLLREPKKMGAIAVHFSVRKSSAYNNLKRLQELGLVEKHGHEWKTAETEKEVVAL
jgi:predicted Rossmann fold nucleotide-binding protein DprA/Smf involved in DNA uptake